MEKWRIIDCSSMEGSIKSVRGGIEIHRDSQEPVKVPVADVAVVLVGINVSFSSATMHRLLSQDVAVLFCDWKGVPEGGAYSWSTHGRVGARHQAQSRLSEPRRKNAWGRLVQAKVKGQANVLKNHGLVESVELFALARDVRSGDPGNIEARAARIYWKALWGHEDFRRLPGSGKDSYGMRNSHLDYAYTVLRRHGIRAVLGAGLSPSMGIFHRGRANNFALVDDLIEPFRPAIDHMVSQLSPDDDISDSLVRKKLVQSASQTFTSNGFTIPTVFVELAQQFGLYVESGIDKLTVPFWQGEF